MRHLLGSTIVVETLDRAIQLERDGLRQRYVSLDGQIVQPSGSISGGHVRSSGLMSRERETHELRERVAKLQGELNELGKRSDTLRETLRAGQERSARLREEIHALQVERAELVKERDACLASLEERQRSVEEYESRRQAWLDEIHTHRETIEEKEEEARRLAAEAEQCEAGLKASQSEMASQDTQVDALAGSLSELRVEIASIQERIDRLRSRTARLTQRREALAAAQARRGEEIAGIAKRRQEFEAEIAQTRGALGRRFESRDALDREIAEAEQGKEEIAHRLRERLQTLHSLQSDRNALQDETQEALLRKNEAEIELGHVRTEAMERFQCAVEDLLNLPEVEVDEEDGEPAEEGVLTHEELQARLWETNQKINAMGLVNMAALEEYEEQAKRLDFLSAQEADLVEACRQLTETIATIDETSKRLFQESFESIRAHFIEMFRRMFGGGRADLQLTDVENGDPLLEGGIEIVAQPPGKKLQSISLLSGGEKALTAVALLFGIFLHKPSPFCVLDEIDAPLDDNNIERFKKLLLEFSQQTQFIIITHSKQTMTLADSIYGVTMEEAGVSKLVAVRFDESLSMVG
ncbi:MAG: hypothetical protein NTW86_17005 [Candidatus Sumerlaeota bacterium]|nr:hypothetical protein [Candidatus Sumerlaeota bacterium]